jgi:hypothetical protein
MLAAETRTHDSFAHNHNPRIVLRRDGHKCSLQELLSPLAGSPLQIIKLSAIGLPVALKRVSATLIVIMNVPDERRKERDKIIMYCEAYVSELCEPLPKVAMQGTSVASCD